MPGTESNGDKVHLTFAQVTWFVAILVAVLWSWGDLRVQLEKLAAEQRNTDRRVEALEKLSHHHYGNRSPVVDRSASEVE